MSGALRILDASRTDVGKVRQANEDSLCSLPESGVWVVADGMGGHHNGQFASQAIVEDVTARFAAPDRDGTTADRHARDKLGATSAALAEAIAVANARIHARGSATGQMGSTVVALVVADGEFAVLWAGDSRAYVLRDGALVQLSRDHSQVEDLVAAGTMTPEEAANHPMKHVLSRAIGVAAEVMLDGVRDRVLPGDVFLLCSDGLTGVVPEPEIARMILAGRHAACDELVAACLARGAPDNVTVTLVEVAALPGPGERGEG